MDIQHPQIALKRIPVTAERNKMRVVSIDFPVKAASGYISSVLAMTMRSHDFTDNSTNMVHLHSSGSHQQGVALHFVHTPLLQYSAAYCDTVGQQKSPENTMNEKLEKYLSCCHAP